MHDKLHTFHIPVMGIGYTIDTAIKVAHLGIDSVLSLVDDGLIEKMREHYCRMYGLEYVRIPIKQNDYRALRITAYLNLINKIVRQKFDKLKNDDLTEGSELLKYVELLPDTSEVKALLLTYKKVNKEEKVQVLKLIKEKISLGSIDVNIMSKGDTVRYRNRNEKLPDEYNDAHAAIRGFLKSDLINSSLIISAGLNPKLFSYLSGFSEIHPNEHGEFNKKIVIKVSDYRSALIQGKYLAQRGVWTSEFRVESGLNCGGHACATKGLLLGPILEEFRIQREFLIGEMKSLYLNAMKLKGINVESIILNVDISAQGGIGTSTEAEFIRSYYKISSVGWGSPFLLVPEVVNIDPDTLKLVSEADESDIYLSNTSPFGIPFYSVVGNTKDEEKQFRIKHDAPGSTCPKRFVALNNEFGDYALCTASKEYQKLKIADIKKSVISPEQKKKEIKNITDKTCICVGLGTAALLVNNLEHRIEGNTVSVCPGPNLAYFSKKATLKEMVDHIYGRINLITNENRPHVFVKELLIYVKFLKGQILESETPIGDKQITYFSQFKDNLIQGIDYYLSLAVKMKDESKQRLIEFEKELKKIKNIVHGISYSNLETAG